jgi:hypothetical protein
MKRLTLIFVTSLISLSSCKAAASTPNTAEPSVVQDVIITPELRNGCAIIATEAFTRLRATGVWTRMLYLYYKDEKTGESQGHMVTVWQPTPSGPTLVYDQYFWNATQELPTDSRDLTAVTVAIGKTIPGYEILSTHYLP